MIANGEVDIRNPGVNECIKSIFEDRLCPGRQHWFGPFCGEWTESDAFAGGEDDRP
jgi:hypothetical protein